MRPYRVGPRKGANGFGRIHACRFEHFQCVLRLHQSRSQRLHRGHLTARIDGPFAEHRRGFQRVGMEVGSLRREASYAAGATALPTIGKQAIHRKTSQVNAVGIQVQLNHVQMHLIQPFVRDRFVLQADALRSSHQRGQNIRCTMDGFRQGPCIACCFWSDGFCRQFLGLNRRGPAWFVPRAAL